MMARVERDLFYINMCTFKLLSMSAAKEMTAGNLSYPPAYKVISSERILQLTLLCNLGVFTF